jgi:hypothetical protein
MLLAAPREASLGYKSDPKAVQKMHAVGECLGHREAETANKVLAADFRSEAYGTVLQLLADLGRECAADELGRGALRSGGLLFAGSVAEGVMRKDSTLSNIAARTAFRPELPTIEARNAGEYMAFCVVRTDPAMVAQLLGTRPATVEEYQALKALGPTMSRCVPANSQSSFTRDALRALLALGTHRLAAHNATAGGAK